MRYNKTKYKKGDKKTKTKFLFLPLTINGETRWFEKATIEYELNEEVSCYTIEGAMIIAVWRPVKFINN